MYCIILTLISVGYGDIIPMNVSEKIFVCALFIVGVGLMGFIISSSTSSIINLISTTSIIKVKYYNDQNIGKRKDNRIDRTEV